MSSNTLGRFFTITTFGESHGVAMGSIVDGVPPGLPLTADDIQIELNRRRPGQSRQTSQRREKDIVEILSGLFEGHTTGAPIGLMIRNEDAHSRDYEALKDSFRPGHADYTYQKKYGVRDYKGGGRSSARETVNWVAAGAIAKKYLNLKMNIQIDAYLAQMGDIICLPKSRAEINENPFFCADPDKIPVLTQLIEEVRAAKDSIGSAIAIEVQGLPVGLGDPVFHKLNADLAHALMSIPGAKGVAFGDGFEVVTQRGSEHRDPITPTGFVTNHSGGTLGGISTGQTLICRIAMKPTSSIPQPIESIDRNGYTNEIVVKGRHDPCIGLRGVPVASALTAIVLLDHLMCDRAQNFESRKHNE